MKAPEVGHLACRPPWGFPLGLLTTPPERTFPRMAVRSGSDPRARFVATDSRVLERLFCPAVSYKPGNPQEEIHLPAMSPFLPHGHQRLFMGWPWETEGKVHEAGRSPTVGSPGGFSGFPGVLVNQKIGERVPTSTQATLDTHLTATGHELCGG